jgi:hypothetical protein
MLVRSCVLASAGIAVTLLLIGLTTLTSASEQTPATTVDCRLVTGTPTTTATPSPTPPFTPYISTTFCNDTANVASDLHVVLSRPTSDDLPATVNPDGCPDPSYSMTGVDGEGNYTVDVHWDTACVDPGESVHLTMLAPCSTPEPGCDLPWVDCFNWQVTGLNVPSVSPAANPGTCEPSLVTPTPTPTPLPTSCDPRPTPMVTSPPTPHNPPPAPYGTNRDVIISSHPSFCNDTGEVATKLRIHFASPFSTLNEINAPGCSNPSVRPVDIGNDEFDLILDWGTPCLQPVVSVVVSFYYYCAGGCPYLTPFCYTWFYFEEELDSEGVCPLIPSILNWGDINCDRSFALLDAIDTLRAVNDLSFDRRNGCPDPNARIEIDEDESVWGDFDCDGMFTPMDALVLLKKRASVEFVPANACPVIDAQVTVSS